MTQFTRRHVLGSTVGAAAVLAGCSESESSSGFTRTAVEGRELVVEFEESLEAETIAVVDPAGESFAESQVSAGVSRVTFEISMPYTPGEYLIVASDGEETIADTTQVIQPELEIVDMGVGANRMDEMPESLGTTKDSEAMVAVKNSGNGPEEIDKLQFLGDLPNPEKLEEGQTGILKTDSATGRSEPVSLAAQSKQVLYTSTLPFSFEGDGIDCSSTRQEGEITVEIHGRVSGNVSREYFVEYSAADTYDSCDISLKEES